MEVRKFLGIPLLVLIPVVLCLLALGGIAYGVSQWSTNIPSGVTVILAPTPTPTATPSPTATPAPNPNMNVSPPELDFGQVYQGQASGTYYLTLTNTGNVPFTNFGTSLSGAPAGVTVTGSGFPGSLAPGDFVEIQVQLSVDGAVPGSSEGISYPFNVVITAYY
jgi:hypothetical protein